MKKKDRRRLPKLLDVLWDEMNSQMTQLKVELEKMQHLARANTDGLDNTIQLARWRYEKTEQALEKAGQDLLQFRQYAETMIDQVTQQPASDVTASQQAPDRGAIPMSSIRQRLMLQNELLHQEYVEKRLKQARAFEADVAERNKQLTEILNSLRIVSLNVDQGWVFFSADAVAVRNKTVDAGLALLKHPRQR